MSGRLATCLLSLGAAAHAQLAGLLEPVALPEDVARSATMNLDRVVKRLQADAGHHVLDGETVRVELERELVARFGVEGELKLALVRPWQAVPLPAEDVSVTVIDAPADGLASSFIVKVRIVSAGETLAEMPLAVRAQLLQPMWAATGRIERGQVLDRAALAVQKVDVLRDRQAFIGAEVNPATLETVQAISTPRLLLRRDVSLRPIVRKGQVVEAVAKRGLLAVSMKALALEAGPVGGLIRLRNLESHKEFNGQIIDENKVQVHF
jgi:flagella basal body P-ring formation protein FlgA